MFNEKSSSDEVNSKIVRVSQNYISEAKEAKRDRMEANRQNFECYHLKQDYSHKKSGQSREFLAKQAMAVEQICSFFQQGLVDIGDWFGVEREPGVDDKDVILTPEEVKLLLERSLEQAGFLTVVHDTIKMGLLGSLMIVKVHGKMMSQPKYFTEKKLKGLKMQTVLKKLDKKAWQLHFDIIRQEDFYPDPTGKGLYFGQEFYLDLAEAYKLSNGDKALYDKDVLDRLASQAVSNQEEKLKKAIETGQKAVYTDFRKKVKIQEFWGTILDPGTGEILFEDVTWSIANDQFVIAQPKPYPFWHGKNPYQRSVIIRVPNSEWGKALMDAPTRNNIALNELYNLIVDAGMMATHGIKQIRTDVLEDESQISNGIPAGTTLAVTSALPHGAKVLERIDTGAMSNESLSVFNLMNGEFQQSALTNDLRLGVLPSRQVKATEVVEASQTITSVFTGIAKVIESNFIAEILNLAWMTILQNMDDLSSEDVISLIGKDRAMELAALSPEERFAKIANGHRFKVYGISRTLDKVKDFRKLTALLQTISGSEILTEEFVKKNDFGKLLEEIMKSLDINVDRLKASEADQVMEAMAQAQGAQGGGSPVQGPNAQSQIPQAATGSLGGSVQSNIPKAHFPPSPASGGGH